MTLFFLYFIYIYIARWEDDIRIVDIAILPSHRNRGLGRTILEEVLAEGKSAGKTVSIHVE